jgi:hypothetical protein
MQQKRQEQQKSIDAYYNKSIQNALLSQVASEFYRRIPLVTLTKDDIEYRNAFSGEEAIVYIHIWHTKWLLVYSLIILPFFFI